MEWFLYDRDVCHERVNKKFTESKWRKITNSHIHVILISHVYISKFMSVSNGWKSQFD